MTDNGEYVTGDAYLDGFVKYRVSLFDFPSTPYGPASEPVASRAILHMWLSVQLPLASSNAAQFPWPLLPKKHVKQMGATLLKQLVETYNANIVNMPTRNCFSLGLTDNLQAQITYKGYRVLCRVYGFDGPLPESEFNQISRDIRNQNCLAVRSFTSQQHSHLKDTFFLEKEQQLQSKEEQRDPSYTTDTSSSSSDDSSDPPHQRQPRVVKKAAKSQSKKRAALQKERKRSPYKYYRHAPLGFMSTVVSKATVPTVVFPLSDDLDDTSFVPPTTLRSPCPPPSPTWQEWKEVPGNLPPLSPEPAELKPLGLPAIRPPPVQSAAAVVDLTLDEELPPSPPPPPLIDEPYEGWVDSLPGITCIEEDIVYFEDGSMLALADYLAGTL